MGTSATEAPKKCSDGIRQCRLGEGCAHLEAAYSLDALAAAAHVVVLIPVAEE